MLLIPIYLAPTDFALINNAFNTLLFIVLLETPPASEEEKLRCEAMKEAVKGMFLNESRTAAEARFIFDNLEKYEELFDRIYTPHLLPPYPLSAMQEPFSSVQTR